MTERNWQSSEFVSNPATSTAHFGLLTAQQWAYRQARYAAAERRWAETARHYGEDNDLDVTAATVAKTLTTAAMVAVSAVTVLAIAVVRRRR